MSDDPILAAIAELRGVLMGRMDRLQARIDQLGPDLLRQVCMLRDRVDGLEGP